MSWWAIDVRPAPAERDSVGAWLVARTGQAIEEKDDGTLVTFADSETAADALIAALRAEHGAPATRRTLDPVDWTTRWRDGIEARRFGRLTVSPSWLDGIDNPGTLTLVLDPEMAFGSGEHGSTRAALALLERHLVPGQRVLDLGSGSGILTIAAVMLGAAYAAGIEIDGEANDVAERNGGRNGVMHAAAFFTADAAELAPLLGPVDLLLSNILRTVNTTLLPAIVRSTAPGGLAIFSGMEEAEAPLFRPVLAAAGFTVADELTDTGWWAVAARTAA